MNVSIKRIYEEPSKTDGVRILVDRLWPRGVSKERAKLNLWLKDIGPTTGPRKWFGHDPKKWAGFQAKYKGELKANSQAIQELKQAARGKNVTLLYAAKDQEHNEAVVIKDFFNE